MTNFSRWIDALESGDYLQTTGVLRRDAEGGQPTFCVAGVAVDLAIKDGVPVEWDADSRTYIWADRCQCGCDLGPFAMTSNHTVPGPVKEWLGVTETPTVAAGVTVIQANDDRAWTFPEIAAGLRAYHVLAEVGA